MKSALTAAVLGFCIALGGCASQWVVDSSVRSYSEIAGAPAAGSGYRFERLPSQQADEARQQKLEAMAAAALDGVGLHRDDSAPRYSAEINARTSTEYPPWPDPWYGGGPWWGPGWGYAGAWGPRPGWGGWYGGGWGGWWAAPPPNPWYAREVSIVLRELPSSRVVYETHARNSSTNSAGDLIFPVMFQAALQGFPNPPQGDRRVDIPVQTVSK